MKKNHYPLFFLFLAAVVLLTACSDEGGTDSGGIGGSGIISTGAVTEIGSVRVNGRRFDTVDAQVYVDGIYVGSGDQIVEQWIAPGQIVRVDGRTTDNGNSAQRVTYTPLIYGPVQEIEIIDSATLRIKVLEQSIIIDRNTRLKNIAVDTAAIGNAIEVSGYLDDAGGIQATFAKRLFDAAPLETVFTLTGAVSSLNLQTRTFLINNQAVDFNNVDIADTEDLAEGQVVTATGSLDAYSSVLTADTLTAFQRLDAIEADQVEIEGIIKTNLLDNGFILDDQPVRLAENTQFLGGDADDLLSGAMVEVDGSYANGVLNTSKIKFGQIFKAESDLAEILDEAAQTFSLDGLEGLTIQTNQLTRYQGQLSSDGFEGLEPGRHLVITGRHVEDRQVWASRIIGLPDNKDQALLRGMVQSIDNNRLTISGVVVDTDTIPSDGFFLNDDEPVTQETFMDETMTGQWITAHGQLLDDQSIAWNKLVLTVTE